MKILFFKQKDQNKLIKKIKLNLKKFIPAFLGHLHQNSKDELTCLLNYAQIPYKRKKERGRKERKEERRKRYLKIQNNHHLKESRRRMNKKRKREKRKEGEERRKRRKRRKKRERERERENRSTAEELGIKFGGG